MNPEELDAVEAAADATCDECGVPHSPTDAHGDEAASTYDEVAASYEQSRMELVIEQNLDLYDEAAEYDDWLEGAYEERCEEEDC